MERAIEDPIDKAKYSAWFAMYFYKVLFVNGLGFAEKVNLLHSVRLIEKRWF
jgi:hypothetical protein